MEAAFAEVVREAIAKGDLANETDAERLARLLIAVAQGMLFLARTGLTDGELDAIGEEATTRLLGEGKPRHKKPRRKRSSSTWSSSHPGTPAPHPRTGRR